MLGRMPVRIEDYAHDRRHPHRRPGGPRRFDRLAVPARLRPAGRASPPCWATRSTDAGLLAPEVAGHRGRAAATGATRWCWRRPSPPPTAWPRSSTSCPCARARRCWCGWWSVATGTVRMAQRPAHALRLRLDRALGAPHRRGPGGGGRRRRPGGAGRRVDMHGRDHRTEASFDVVARRPPGLHHGLVPVRRAGAHRRRLRRSRWSCQQRTEPWWRDVGRAGPRCPSEWPDAVRRSLITLKALTYAPDRRHRARRPPPRCPRSSVAAGTGTTATAGCATPPSPSHALLDSGYETEADAWAPLAAPGGGRQSRPPPDHVRPRRSPAPDRGDPRLAARLRGLGAGADRQRGQPAVPARRVRRDPGHVPHAGVPATASCNDGRRGAWPGSWSSTWPRSWQRARRGDLGGARPAPALRALQGHGLGGRRPLDQAMRRPRPDATSRSSRWQALRDEIHAEVCDRGRRPRPRLLRAVLRLDRARRQPADAGPGRVPAPRRSAHRATVDGRRGRPDGRRVRAAATAPTRRRARRDDRSTGCPPGEGAFLLTHVLAGRQPGAHRVATTRPWPCSNGSSACATT